MRLTAQEQEAIKDSFRQCFGETDHLWLFGSRVDDQKRGGDIDLYVETALTADQAVKAKLSFLGSVQDQIGEQKIDVVLNVLPLAFHQPIYQIAKTEGIQMV